VIELWGVPSPLAQGRSNTISQTTRGQSDHGGSERGPPTFQVEPKRAYARGSGALPGTWEHKAHNPSEFVMSYRHCIKHPALETPLYPSYLRGRPDVR